MEWGGEIAIWSHSHGEWARVVTRNRRGISKQPWGSAEHGTTRSECCQAAGLVLLFFFCTTPSRAGACRESRWDFCNVSWPAVILSVEAWKSYCSSPKALAAFLDSVLPRVGSSFVLVTAGASGDSCIWMSSPEDFFPLHPHILWTPGRGYRESHSEAWAEVEIGSKRLEQVVGTWGYRIWASGCWCSCLLLDLTLLCWEQILKGVAKFGYMLLS